MKKLKKRIKRKKQIYQLYEKKLRPIKEVTLLETDLLQTTPWFIDIYVKNPNKLAAHLKEKGIGTRKIYPAIHTQKIYKDQWGKKPFPVSTKVAQQGLWLPSSSKLTNTQINYICQQINTFYLDRQNQS